MWYVIQVGAGKEEEIARELQKQGIRALVPVEDRPIHSKGAWIRKRYVIFSGYVFVSMAYKAENYYRVRKIPGRRQRSVIWRRSGSGCWVRTGRWSRQGSGFRRTEQR